ncbi:MAG TPA: nitrous oxide reductase family maturation protein NosD [Flavobacteriales bacterium]|nr:nitrous oxide reductase family maturation protein NosD [Flavobacteriales bacterium]
MAAIVSLLWTTGPLTAKTWTVDANGALNRIGKAIASASSGDTIRVLKGIYREGIITVDKPLALIGVDLPVIDGEEKGDVLVIEAPNVLVTGFKVTGTLVSNINDNAAIKVKKADDVRLIGNVVEHTFFGIHVASSRRTLIQGNTVTGDPAVPETRRANAIHLWHCSDARILDNLATDHRDGIYFEFVGESHIEGNRSLRNLRYGLHFMFSNNDSYSDNHFEDNGAGVAVMYSKFVDMRRNQFISNRGASAYGLLLKEINDVVVDSNQFVDNTTAILVDGCNRGEIKGNLFRANGWAIRLYANSMDCRFNGNSFVANTFDMSTNGNPVYNSFSGNYWDRYKGYDLNRDGVGDVPFRPLSLFAMVNERMPYAVVLSRSLLTGLMDQAERLIPSMTPEGLEDDKPLMKQPYGTRDL